MIELLLDIDNDEEIELSVVHDKDVNLAVDNEIYKDFARDYNDLKNKPRVEGVELVGDKTLEELGMRNITPQEIDKIIYGE